jgi:putative transposase
VTRYRCVDAQKAAGFPVAAVCQATGVTRSAYYAFTAKRPSQRQQDDASLVGEIRRIHTRSYGTYGAPRVHAELRRRGWAVNHKRVERLMRTHGIVGYRPRRRRSLTKPDHGAAPAPDMLGRLFDPDRPDMAWCGDVTWIPTDEGWLYLASVIDLASRHLLGWSMSVITTPPWSATRWRLPWPPAADPRCPTPSSPPTAAPNTPRPPASLPASGWGCDVR